jgi:CitMHS family citrate-Mg2+:H+ or citrate-Ca2+:H+ symporter
LILTLLGFGMVVTFMTLIMLRRLSPLVALILVPITFALLSGFGVEIGEMMLEGIKKIAPTGVMLMFAILYFGVMIDAGLFDPLIRAILRVVGDDPARIVVGGAVLAMAVGLDGDGSTTYMITVSAMLPLYRRLGMDSMKLAGVTMLASGVMNLTPWGGPTARAATALHVDPTEVFLPFIGPMIVALAAILALAYALGLRERQRLGRLVAPGSRAAAASLSDDEDAETVALKRPGRRWANGLLTAALMASLVLGLLPMAVLFMVGFALAVLINYPDLAQQRQRVIHHAGNALPVVSVIFAAGIFTGILSNTGMVEAMSRSFLAIIPESMGPYLAVITAVVSLPFTFFMSNDAFYFGVLPVLSEAAGHYGITPLQMARASLIGQPVHLLSPLVPATYLLVAMAKVEFSEFQRFTLKWAVLICGVLLVASLALGLFPLVGSG